MRYDPDERDMPFSLEMKSPGYWAGVIFVIILGLAIVLPGLMG